MTFLPQMHDLSNSSFQTPTFLWQESCQAVPAGAVSAAHRTTVRPSCGSSLSCRGDGDGGGQCVSLAGDSGSSWCCCSPACGGAWW